MHGMVLHKVRSLLVARTSFLLILPTVNEPWMYPEMLPHIKAAILRRYELIPYLYALSWEAATQSEGLSDLIGWRTPQLTCLT